MDDCVDGMGYVGSISCVAFGGVGIEGVDNVSDVSFIATGFVEFMGYV